MYNYLIRTLWSLFMVVMLAACGGGDDPASSGNSGNSGSGNSGSEESKDNPNAKDPVFLEFKLGASSNSKYLESDARCSISNAKLEITAKNIKTKAPVYAGMTLTPSFKVNDNHKVYVENKEQRSGITPQDFTKPVQYRVVNENGKEAVYTVTMSFSFTGLPIVSIRTKNGGDIASKDYWVDATISIVGGPEFEDLELTSIQVSGRGNSTWSNNPKDKNPYKFKFEKRTKVLGMPKHKRWVLLANKMDKTMLRNDIAFYLGKQTSLAWTPNGYHVELVINGNHKGNYYLCEQIRIDKNRVNINEMKPKAELTDADDITGGYLLEMDTYWDEQYKFRSNIAVPSNGDAEGNTMYTLPINVKAPDADDMSSKQFAYIQKYFHEAEAALYSENWLDSEKGYKNYYDIQSFVDIYLVSELIYHHEWKWPKSTYLHKDMGGKLVAGPMWDYDYDTFTQRAGPWYCKRFMWFPRFFEDPEFKALVKKRWAELYPKFKTAINYMSTMKNKLKPSADKNYAIWTHFSGPNGEGSFTFEQAVDKIQDRFKERIEWLNSEIPNL